MLKKKVTQLSLFDYLKVDEQNVNSLTKLSDQDKKDIQITMVLPEQNENGDWLAYGFTSRETLDAYIEKDKKST